MSWLRLLGYNALTAWRRLAPKKDGKPVAWARAMETLRDAHADASALLTTARIASGDQGSVLSGTVMISGSN